MRDMAMEAAQQRMMLRPVSESGMAMEGQANAGGMRRVRENGTAYYDSAPHTEYPRMLYRQTKEEQTQPHADAIGNLKDPAYVINRFDGLLCDTIIANSATEAEALSADGWEVSPRAAHGLASGIAQATSAKDDEIAALRAALAERDAEMARVRPENGGEMPIRRGPGRPRAAHLPDA